MESNFVNPKREYKTVFLANIKKSVKNSKDTDEDNNTIFYDALRKHWHNVGEWINSNDMYAVGLFDNQSVYACKINEWHKYTDSDEGERYEFSGEPFLDSDLICKDWAQILEVVNGYWKWGNWIIVQFNGKGSFKILRGSKENKDWISCLPLEENEYAN